MIALVLTLFVSAFAATESKNAFELSYPRDNTFCSLNQKRLEILVRGGSKFTEAKDKGYGELLFYKVQDKKPVLLKLSESKSDTFRLFHGKSTLCSKSHGHLIDEKTFAVLLLKENKPFKDKLVVQLFDAATLTPKESLESDYPVDRGLKTEGGFAVRTFNENYNRDFGKVSIEGQSYIYHEEDFPEWVTYSGKGFATSGELTFKNFTWKKPFKDQEDFFLLTGWNKDEGRFGKKTMFIAVNHMLRKKCFLFVEKKQKLTGTEVWRCHALHAE